MTADAIVEPGKIDIGRVISETVQVLRRNIVSFSILGLLLTGLPTAVISFIQVATLRARAVDVTPGNFNISGSFFEGVGVAVLTALITNAILQGALIYVTVQDLNGKQPTVGEALATGLRNFLPLIGLSILLGIAVVFGFVLFLVPGIMMACAWCVAVPSLVADRTGVFGAFGRSAELTKGNRWMVFALGVLLIVILLVVSTIFNAMIGGSNPATILTRMTNPVVLVLFALRQTVTAVIGSTLAAVLYVELRHVREGAGPEWLSDVFS